jgi:hypothetical protein
LVFLSIQSGQPAARDELQFPGRDRLAELVYAAAYRVGESSCMYSVMKHLPSPRREYAAVHHVHVVQFVPQILIVEPIRALVTVIRKLHFIQGVVHRFRDNSVLIE